ncbi:hypothetical protein A3206_03410 [Candidatus Methanomassiliicoccus intestinalis]|uniref:Uncharacterized protein n=1 Tax=Methanomassiliicoccus intestinalis (strain Issoire-Mx1) TaxID=1295009 RepID=R9TBT2_METII|nr:hypothetical protein [Candidatus Methanomassiliicoccus intestinalis]AGN26913.1 hypothetical protein MMINT_16100 [Candidatus Methanomassiliicoccus intestinalis Issoire-Mx1]TQS83886.1 MAG: hypothetical protein A3206_03410 [Candidatus Methanomassiliicoccus intestinalis]
MQNKNRLLLAMGTVLLAAFCFIAVGALEDSSSDNDVTLSATSTEPVAMVGTETFTTLEAALEYAFEGDTIILLGDYTMSQSATLYSGVSLLIPCMDDDVGYTSTGYNPDGTTSSVKTLYRTLTIPENVVLTVEGSILVNAVTGYPAGGDFDQDIRGGYAQINLSGDIIVENGGLLDNCGYIKGAGQVTAKSGAEIRDLFVIESWRGGSHALNLIGGLFDVILADEYHDPFPLNEYNCHNIESTVKIESGSSFIGNVKMYGASSFNYTLFPLIDNTNGLIRLAPNAYIIKTYNETASNGAAANDTGRTTIQIYGGATADDSTLNFTFSGVSKDLSTSRFTFPVDGDIEFELHSGNYTFNDNFKFLTGSVMTVYADATLTVPSDKKVVFYDEFNDIDNNGTSEYPQRDAAYILLKGNSTLNIQGSFAGIVKCETSLDQVIVGANAVTINIESKEANGYNNKTAPSVSLYFDLQTQLVTA